MDQKYKKQNTNSQWEGRQLHFVWHWSCQEKTLVWNSPSPWESVSYQLPFGGTEMIHNSYESNFGRTAQRIVFYFIPLRDQQSWDAWPGIGRMAKAINIRHEAAMIKPPSACSAEDLSFFAGKLVFQNWKRMSFPTIN